ncbi:hypothetical protein BD324DRAFT_318054 [Kockovaella imperatae]|uniref:Uncharacterized protein n=1 Tax=Kockovaella imperatae TaxID=4999 RepID=A0A1Y1UMD5_9TREE|nr:hypothetical protein BD324DRAFT_318054 [Kockovaella imperatae]ORX39213.1 hypothetical protein BD324DRAFT_318054 [Kockovaella imperatae]
MMVSMVVSVIIVVISVTTCFEIAISGLNDSCVVSVMPMSSVAVLDNHNGVTRLPSFESISVMNLDNSIAVSITMAVVSVSVPVINDHDVVSRVTFLQLPVFDIQGPVMMMVSMVVSVVVVMVMVMFPVIIVIVVTMTGVSGLYVDQGAVL